MVNGHTLDHAEIPWELASLTSGPVLKELAQDQYRVDYYTAQKQHRWITLTNQDFHAMGKSQLGAIVANYC
jgi:hypothetical protein